MLKQHFNFQICCMHDYHIPEADAAAAAAADAFVIRFTSVKQASECVIQPLILLPVSAFITCFHYLFEQQPTQCNASLCVHVCFPFVFTSLLPLCVHLYSPLCVHVSIPQVLHAALEREVRSVQQLLFVV